jgi:hypothetical protein
MFSRIYMICYVVLSILIAGCATTQTGSPTIESGAVIVETEDFRAAIVFSDDDRAKIRHYYKNKYKSKELPPGLAKKHESHPGLRNHIRKYRDLPSGIQGKRLPVDLERTLQSIPEGNVRIRVGGDIMLMNERTRYVLDVIFDVD